jgi:very-short-patch-repair endonuclease
MHWEARFRQLSGRQEGVVGIDQLGELGCDGDHWARAKRSGRWIAMSRRVVRRAGLTSTPALRAHAAVLDAGGGAFLHGGSALAWFDLRGFDLARPQVARPRGTTSTPCELAAVHRVRDIDEVDLVVVRGVRTMTPLRAIWSEASRYSDEPSFDRGVVRIGRLLDLANRRDLVRWDELHRSIERLGRRGRAGTRVLRAAAERRRPGTSATESRNEDRFEEVLAEAGAAPMERQVVVGGDRPIGRSDHRDPDHPLVVEVNSLAFHSTPSDQDADEERYAALVAAGFTVVVVWEDALWSNTASVVAAVRAGRRHARRGHPAVVHTVGCPWPYDPDRIVVGADTRRYRG